MSLEPFSWKDKPALIEKLFPVQKLSVESFKEQMAGAGKTLTALGSYWKGRKPLILNKACVLGSLLPCTDDPVKDLEIFDMLMAFDGRSMAVRLGLTSASYVAERYVGAVTKDYFEPSEAVALPDKTPFDIREYPYRYTDKNGKEKTKNCLLKWRKDISYWQQLSMAAEVLPERAYREHVSNAKRPEEIMEVVHDHIWERVNEHLGIEVSSFPLLIEQLGIARYGRRPKVGDTFCGSGQIPFEAARLGCDVYASDLNPIACMLTWGAFNIVGADESERDKISKLLMNYLSKIKGFINNLGVEKGIDGWKGKTYLYCLEVKCPESGWIVPLLPTLIISKGYKVIAKLIPDQKQKRYLVKIEYASSNNELESSQIGTVQNGYLVHSPDESSHYRIKISAIRGDNSIGRQNSNQLRQWCKLDFTPNPEDIFQERLYCIQWVKNKESGRGFEYKFTSVNQEDEVREQEVIEYVREHLEEWQEKGWVPDMVIEAGDKTDEPIRTRGWTHWHHLFNPRQLLLLSIVNSFNNVYTKIKIPLILDRLSRLNRWDNSVSKGCGNTANVFDNQALNTLYNYGCRASNGILDQLTQIPKYQNISGEIGTYNHMSSDIDCSNDLYITDPPYGDAVKYEEITEFFIAWLRKNPPPEFANWTWDSRRALAIKGEDEDFRQGMIRAYKAMAEHMPDNGIQILMFTHKSGSIWADLATIVWAAGLQVTAAWYVVTETDSALRQGANVTGTILLVLRKRIEKKSTFRDELAWEIKDEVKNQMDSLTGLDKTVREQNNEGLYNDADLQMAGYAAALKALTTYSVIDGKDMEIESKAPRKKGVKSFVDEMIDFAIQNTVEYLVPTGFENDDWKKLSPVERYYLKMLDMEAQGEKTLDNYQNFAKAFKIRKFEDLMGVSRANSARLKMADELKGSYMSGENELAGTPLRALIYAIWETTKDKDIEEVLSHLMENVGPSYFQVRPLIVLMAKHISTRRDLIKGKAHEAEASAARVLSEAVHSQRL
nr:DUF1156 domain-containing protein [Desulfobulbaceae bacterium]